MGITLQIFSHLSILKLVFREFHIFEEFGIMHALCDNKQKHSANTQLHDYICILNNH